MHLMQGLVEYPAATLFSNLKENGELVIVILGWVVDDYPVPQLSLRLHVGAGQNVGVVSVKKSFMVNVLPVPVGTYG